MANAVANVPTQMKDGVVQAVPMDGAAQTIFQGTIVCRDASGYAVKGANTSGYVFAGIAYEKKVIAETETDGATKIRVWRRRLHRFAISSVAITDVGSWVYVSDDQTVTLTAGYVPVGVIVAIEGTTWVWVDIEPALTTIEHEAHDHSSAAAGGGLVSPEITTGIEDANGAEAIGIAATTGAVNHVQIVNAATGVDPAIAATGDDTNVGLDVKSQGTGVVALVADDTDVVRVQKDTDAYLGFFDATLVVQQSHIADPAACADMTATLAGVDTGTDMTAAQAATIVADLAALKAAVDANNAAVDAALAVLEAYGLVATE